MRLTIQLKLLPTPEQADALHRTLVRANAACDYISQVAWNARTFGQFPIHRLTYGAVRETFALSAQLTVRCIAKVADAYKLDKHTQRAFAPLGAVAFDERILAYKSASVSIWTLEGRQAIPFVCGARQKALLAFRRGESDLAFVRGNWYLFATADIETPDPIDVEGVLGIDLGVTNIAVDNDGETTAGAQSRMYVIGIGGSETSCNDWAPWAVAAACGFLLGRKPVSRNMSTTVSPKGLLRRLNARSAQLR